MTRKFITLILFLSPLAPSIAGAQETYTLEGKAEQVRQEACRSFGEACFDPAPGEGERQCRRLLSQCLFGAQ